MFVKFPEESLAKFRRWTYQFFKQWRDDIEAHRKQVISLSSSPLENLLEKQTTKGPKTHHHSKENPNNHTYRRKRSKLPPITFVSRTVAQYPP
jgi:hypothetical protein